MQDLFDTPELLPANVQEIINRYGEKLINGDGDGYEVCAQLVAELETVGYTCDYYLDAQPFGLQKVNPMAPTHEIDQELVKLNQSYEPIF